MSKHFSIVRFVGAVLLLDLVLIGLVFYTGANAAAFLSSRLPGTFGPGMGNNMTGNHLLGALIVMLDAVLFLGAGLLVLIAASRNALMIGGGGLGRLLKGTAGLSQEDIAAASFAVAEEQKSEIRSVDTGKHLIWIGALLLLLAFPAVCFTFAQADVKGAPLLVDAGGAVANTAITIEDAIVFAADQLANAVLLDVPQVFQWHLTSLQPGHSHHWLRPFVLLYHILSKLVVLATLFAAWRTGNLRAYVLAMAGPEAVIAVSSLRGAAGGFAHQPPAPVPETPAEEPVPEPAHEHPMPESVYVEHRPPAEPVAEPAPEHPEAQAVPEEPPVVEVPVYTEPPHEEVAPDQLHSEAPLALHELRAPANDEAGDGLSRDGLAYKHTALHLTNQEFDA